MTIASSPSYGAQSYLLLRHSWFCRAPNTILKKTLSFRSAEHCVIETNSYVLALCHFLTRVCCRNIRLCLSHIFTMCQCCTCCKGNNHVGKAGGTWVIQRYKDVIVALIVKEHVTKVKMTYLCHTVGAVVPLDTGGSDRWSCCTWHHPGTCCMSHCSFPQTARHRTLRW